MRDAAARSFKLGEGAQAPWKWERKAMAGEMKKQRASWSGKWAFILAAAASAVGLGNMWRFPYLAAKYGGGTFLLTYVVLVFTFGVSLLLLETALGRKTGQSAIGAFKAFGKKYAFIGILASAVPFIITPYYCIIGGWVTKYTAAYLVNGHWRPWPTAATSSPASSPPTPRATSGCSCSWPSCSSSWAWA